MRPKAAWAIDSEAMGARGINVLVVGQKNIETKHLSQVKARHQSFFTVKTLFTTYIISLFYRCAFDKIVFPICAHLRCILPSIL